MTEKKEQSALAAEVDMRFRLSVPSDKEKVTLVVDGVNACDRYLLNVVSRSFEDTRGELVSKVLRELAIKVYGAEEVNAMIKEFEADPKKEQQKSVPETGQSPSVDL